MIFKLNISYIYLTMSFFTKNKKVDTSFVLKGINPTSLDVNYGLNEIQKTIAKNDKKTVIDLPDNLSFGKRKNISEKSMNSITTKLENLGISTISKEVLKTTVHSNTIMKFNMITTFNKEINLRNVRCFHCKHCVPDDLLPLSLPIKYFPKTQRTILNHHSQFNSKKEVNSESENLLLFKQMFTKKQYDKLKNKENITEEYFSCEGVFCSFNCMLSFCREYNNSSCKYRESSMLIILMYKKFFGKMPHNLEPAPSWKLLQDFGGHLTIEDFRNSFQTIKYNDNNRYLIHIAPQIFEEIKKS